MRHGMMEGSPTPVTPLTTWQGVVSPDWVDYNGHLRDAYYLLLFSFATDALMDRLGLDEAGRLATGHSLFTLECHLNFLHEVKVGTQVEVFTQVLAHDNKRLHIFHSLHAAGAPLALAASEQMLLNVDTTGLSGPRSAAFAAPVLAAVQALGVRHQSLVRPAHVGRVMALPAAKATISTH